MRNLAKNKTYEYLKATYFIRFFGDAFFHVQIYVYLSYRGLSDSQIGVIAGFAPLFALLGSIVFAKLAKNVNVNRKLLIIIGVIESIISLVFMFFVNSNFVFYFIFISISAFFNGNYYALLDGYSGTYITRKQKQYSSMRMMGSIAYIFAPIISGLIIQTPSLNYPVSFFISFVFLLVTSLMTFFLPKEPIAEEIKEKKGEEKFHIKTYPKLLTYAIFNFFVIATATTSDNFFSVYFRNRLELSSSLFGYFVAGTVAVETIIFVFIIYRKNMFNDPTFSYIFMGVFALMRPLTVALNIPPFLLVPLGLLRGIAWGYYLVYNVKYLSKIIPIHHLTTGLFFVAFFNTSGRMLTSLIVGPLLNSYSYSTVFIFITLFMILGIVISTILAQVDKRRDQIRVVTNFNE